MTSSEAVPFSKSGGLADVSSSLPIALSNLGHEVRLILPNYGLTDDSKFTSIPVNFTVSIAGKDEKVEIVKGLMNNVIVYLINHPYFTKRKGIYGDTSFSPYHDNLLRFTLMSKAVLQLCTEIEWIPEILHCHDWTTGLIPYMVKKNPAFSSTKTVFTIHNLAYQGEFPRLDMLLTEQFALLN